MSRLLLTHPNPTAGMTERVCRSAERIAIPETRIEATTCLGASVPIEGIRDDN